MSKAQRVFDFIKEHPGANHGEIHAHLISEGLEVVPTNTSATLNGLSVGGRIENRGGRGYRKGAWYVVDQSFQDDIPCIDLAREILEELAQTPKRDRPVYLAYKIQDFLGVEEE